MGKFNLSNIKTIASAVNVGKTVINSVNSIDPSSLTASNAISKMNNIKSTVASAVKLIQNPDSSTLMSIVDSNSELSKVKSELAEGLSSMDINSEISNVKNELSSIGVDTSNIEIPSYDIASMIPDISTVIGGDS